MPILNEFLWQWSNVCGIGAKKNRKGRGGEYSPWLDKRGVYFAEDAFGIEEQGLFHKAFSRYISKNIKEIPFFYDHIFPHFYRKKGRKI